MGRAGNGSTSYGQVKVKRYFLLAAEISSHCVLLRYGFLKEMGFHVSTVVISVHIRISIGMQRLRLHREEAKY